MNTELLSACKDAFPGLEGVSGDDQPDLVRTSVYAFYRLHNISLMFKVELHTKSGMYNFEIKVFYTHVIYNYSIDNLASLFANATRYWNSLVTQANIPKTK